jgi:UDP-N-acetylglucosamine 2-epimerase (non-hydrolysing)
VNKVAVIFGTRPEAVKLCPVVLALRAVPELDVQVCVTAQHRSMLDQILDVFGVQPDADLNLMQPNQSLAALTSRAVTGVAEYLEAERPDLVIVQGDTTTAFAAALAAFYRHIPVGHVEAGLRTGDMQAPFPEEMNRVLTTQLAELHFAPTTEASGHLRRAGVREDRIFVTGNTVIDALEYAVQLVRSRPQVIDGLAPALANGEHRELVLITGHRRENFGAGFRAICSGIAQLAELFPDVAFVYPVHLNPNVRAPVHSMLGGRKNVHLIEPLSYLPFVALMDRCTMILTDSGGIQEEAPSLGKPVLVMRETTERPEAVREGTARLVGTDVRRIVAETSRLLSDPAERARMVTSRNPYGDGHASERIVRTCLEFFGVASTPVLVA